MIERAYPAMGALMAPLLTAVSAKEVEGILPVMEKLAARAAELAIKGARMRPRGRVQ